MPKLTFSLDDATVKALRAAAHRLGKPQSFIVREAIAEYAAREDRLSPPEQTRLLTAIDRIESRPTARPAKDVDRELEDVRRSRRTGWSRPGR